MNCCILGMGRTGHAMAAYLSRAGACVTVWDRSAKKCEAIRRDGVKTEGQIDGVCYPAVRGDIGDAVSGAEYILVTTVSEAHRPIAELLKGHLRKDQRIVIFNGNLGAYEFYTVLKAEAAEKAVLIAETGGMLFIADFMESGVCFVKSIKNHIDLSAIPSTAAQPLSNEMHDLFPQLMPVKNILETSFNNANPVLHTPISLFNITRIEGGEDFLFYDTAATRSVVAFAEKVDSERCKVLEALGVSARSCLDILNSFWQEQYQTLYDTLKNNKAYMSGKGPVSIRYRYFTEDLPYGIAPLSILGKQCGVPTPCIDTMLECYRLLLDTDYLAAAPALTELDRFYSPLSTPDN